jgi:hypothetical protein
VSRALALALAVTALALAGCGSSSQPASSGGDEAKAPRPAPTARGGPAEREAPKGASPVLREIYRQFPKPEPDPSVKASAAVIKAGEKACAGRSPRQVKDEFYGAAVKSGALVPGSDEAKMIAQLPKFEKNASADTAFVAGQLAADVYSATLPEATARFGYQGCIHAMARRLERELAPGK